MIEKQTHGFGYLAGQSAHAPHKKSLLFIHGAGQNSHFWSPQIEGLAHHFNTFALDLPGHHRSQGPPMTSVPQMAAAVMGFITTTKLPQVIPCGLSMGGAVVLQLLLDQPERFPEAILANTGARLKVLPDIMDAVANNYDDYLKALFHFAVPAKKRTPELKIAMAHAMEPDNTVTLTDLAACNAFDVMPRLSEIQSRVLVLAAEKDISTPLKYGQLLSDKLKNASLALLEGCGHFSSMESPEEFNKTIHSFF